MTGHVYPLKCRIRAAADAEVTRIDVYDDIGDGGWFWGGISPADFAAQMAGVTGPLDVHINSAGGDVFDGITIANTIRGHSGPVTITVDGLAASIASVIAQAGGDRIMQPGSMMMVHDASGSGYGVNAAEARELADVLDKVSDNLASLYAGRAGGTAEAWRDVMRAETWYTADEAVTAGLADRVGEGQAQLPAGLDPAAVAPFRIAARLRAMPRAARPRNDGGTGGCGCCSMCTGPGCGCCSLCTPDASDEGCSTCGGTGKARHPDTGQFTGPCPDCQPGGAQGRGGRARNAEEPDEDGKVTCPLCEGTGKIREGHVKCPDCGGTGKVDADDAENRAPRRVLGIESMPLAEALPVHHTATVDEPWDGPAAVAAMPNDATVLRYCHAWEDSAADDGTADDPDGDADDTKANYKFPHHKAKGGPANVNACRAILQNLAGGRTPANIPDEDKAGVKAHAQAHLDDAEKGDGTDGHAHHGFSDEALANLETALRGAFA